MLRFFLGLFFSPVLILVLSAQSAHANSEYSGSWYNPARNYEGFEFQVLENGNFLLIFYTYPGPTDDENATQSFILGVGTLDGTTATIEVANRTRGPVFGDDYDRDDLEEYAWGTFTVEFADSNNATVSYEGLDGSGSTEVTRLTTLAAGDNGGGLPAGISAVWYDPETNGQGWFVEVLSPSLAIVYWFTYDANGNQAWNIGVGEITGDTILVREALAGRGSRFGAEFDTNDVSLDPFGAYALEFQDCDSATVGFFAIDGSVTGRLELQRLTRLEGFPCDDEVFSPENGTLTMMSNSSDPVLSSYVSPDGTRFDQFVRRGPGGAVVSETGGEIVLPNGEVFSLAVSPEGDSFTMRPLDPGVWLRFAQDSGKLSITAIDKATGATSQAAIDLPASGSSVQSTGTPAAESTNKAVEGLSRVSDSHDPTEAFVQVSHCSEPTADALVSFYVGDEVEDNQRPWLSNTLRIPAIADPQFPGEYSANLLESSAEEISQAAIQASCSNNTLSEVCSVLNPLPPGYPSVLDFLCSRVAQAVSVTAGPIAGAVAYASCKASDVTLDLACGSMFVRDRFCELAPEVFRNTAGLSLDIWAAGSMPHDGADATVGPVDFPDIGGFVILPDLALPDRPVLTRPQSQPLTPIAGDDYELTLFTSCTEPGQVFKVQQFQFIAPIGPERECVITQENGTCTVTHTTESTWIPTGETTGVSDFAVTSPINKVSLHSVNLRTLQAPELISPLAPDGTQPNFCEGADTVTWPFVWNEVDGAVSYNLGITHPDFEIIEANGLVPDPASEGETAIQFDYVFEGDGPFEGDELTGWEWGVQAVSQSGVLSEWSYVGNFSVESCGASELDLTGSWLFVDTLSNNDCGDPNAGTVGVVQIFQTGSSLELCLSNYCIEGSLSGNSVEWSGSFPDDGGTTTSSITGTVSSAGTMIDGSTSWSWTDGNFSCSGNSTFVATKL